MRPAGEGLEQQRALGKSLEPKAAGMLRLERPFGRNWEKAWLPSTVSQREAAGSGALAGREAGPVEMGGGREGWRPHRRLMRLLPAEEGAS